MVVFLDACHSGGVGQTRGALASIKQGFSTDAYDQLSSGSGRVVIASCQPDEVSWELDGMNNGLFTHYLLEGLRGKVADEDGGVRALRLFSYLSRQVLQHKDQHPLLKAAEASADIVVCQIPSNVAHTLPGERRDRGSSSSTRPAPSISELPQPEPKEEDPPVEPKPPTLSLEPKFKTNPWLIVGAVLLVLLLVYAGLASSGIVSPIFYGYPLTHPKPL